MRTKPESSRKIKNPYKSYNKESERNKAKKEIFHLIVDNGKPFEYFINSKKELIRQLEIEKKNFDTGDYPQYDIQILDYQEHDVTDHYIKDGLIQK